MINNEAKRELLEQANQLAYDFIKHSGLYRQFSSNLEHDQKASAIADEIYALADRLADREFKTIEEREAEMEVVL